MGTKQGERARDHIIGMLTCPCCTGKPLSCVETHKFLKISHRKIEKRNVCEEKTF